MLIIRLIYLSFSFFHFLTDFLFRIFLGVRFFVRYFTFSIIVVQSVIVQIVFLFLILTFWLRMDLNWGCCMRNIRGLHYRFTCSCFRLEIMRNYLVLDSYLDLFHLLVNLKLLVKMKTKKNKMIYYCCFLFSNYYDFSFFILFL